MRTDVYVHIYYRQNRNHLEKVTPALERPGKLSMVKKFYLFCLAIEYHQHCIVFLATCHAKKGMEPFRVWRGKVLTALRLPLYQPPWSFCFSSTSVHLWIVGLESSMTRSVFYIAHIATGHAFSRCKERFQNTHDLLHHFLWESSDNYRFVCHIIANCYTGSAEMFETMSTSSKQRARANLHEEGWLYIANRAVTNFEVLIVIWCAVFGVSAPISQKFLLLIFYNLL